MQIIIKCSSEKNWVNKTHDNIKRPAESASTIRVETLDQVAGSDT